MSEEYIKTDIAIIKGVLHIKKGVQAMRLSHVEHVQVSPDVDEGGDYSTNFRERCRNKDSYDEQ